MPALTLLAHPDLRRVGERVLLPALSSGRSVPLSRLTPLFAQPGEDAERPLADRFLSRTPLQLVPEGPGPVPSSVRLVAEGSGGRFEILSPGPAGEIPRAGLERGTVIVLANRVALLLHLLPTTLPREAESFGLVGESAALVHLRQEIRRTAVVGTPVLLRGETGTGKELVAKAIHAAGPRRGRPYLALNLGAVPAALAASELFGAARGAFTGADRRRAGYFERADSGTLFLDEIGEAPPEVQVLLLRALESGEIQPVGAEAAQRVDVRVVAATDAHLDAAAEEGRFRAPLLHRLRGYEIRLPPLRERRDDIGRLLVHFLREELVALGEERRLEAPDARGQPWLSAILVARLADYDWPGNVRELRNVARRIAVDSHDAGGADLTAGLDRPRTAVSQEAPLRSEPPATRPRASYRSVTDIAEEDLFEALRDSRWNLAAAAGRLRVSRTSLYLLVERHGGLRKAADLSRDEILSALDAARGDLEAAAAALRVSPHGLKIRRTELGIH